MVNSFPSTYSLSYQSAGRGSRLVQVPLTRDDLLDPQEGDMMVHGPLHGLFIRTLADMLDRWFDAEDVAVFDNVKMLWGIPGVADVASAGSKTLEIVVEDAATGERLLTSADEAAGHRAEAAARAVAEHSAAEEAAARAVAERKAAEETAARAVAEHKAAEETAARRELESELRRLKEEIERLDGSRRSS